MKKPVKATVKTTPKTTATTVPATTAPASTVPAAPVTTKEATPAKPAGSTIKIGLISAETGTASSAYKNSPIVAKAWERWVNTEMGGVGGHPVEVVTADDKNDAAGAQAAAADLIDSKNVVALVLQDSTAESGLQTLVNDRKFPVVGGSANNAAAGIGYGVSPYYFMTSPGGPAGGESAVVIAKALGQTPYTAAVCAEVAACAAGAKQAENKAKAVNLDYAGVLTVLGSAPSYTPECLEIMSRIASIGRAAGFVSVGLAPTAFARFVKDCSRQGYEGYWGASANVTNQAILDAIDNIKVAGYVNGFPWWADAAPVKAFRAVMAKYAPGDDYREPASTGTWTALEMFRKTMSTAGSTVTKDDVLKAYWNVKNESLDGLLPKTITYSEGKPSPLMNCYWAYTYKVGKFAQLVLDANTTGNGQTNDLRTYCG